MELRGKDKEAKGRLKRKNLDDFEDAVVSNHKCKQNSKMCIIYSYIGQ